TGRRCSAASILARSGGAARRPPTRSARSCSIRPPARCSTRAEPRRSRPRLYWVIVSDSGVPWLAEPLLPVIVTMLGPPVVALRLAVIFRIEFALAFGPPAVTETGLGLKLA